MADPTSPFKLVHIKVRDYLARERKRRKEEEERQSRIEGLRKYERKLRRDKRDAEIARRRAARRADDARRRAEQAKAQSLPAGVQGTSVGGIGIEQLQQRSARLHQQYRSREPVPEDTLLVRHSHQPEGNGCDVLYLSAVKIREKVVPAVAKLAPKGRQDQMPEGSRSAYSVLHVQDMRLPTDCTFDREKKLRTIDCMPGGMPLVDHLAAAVKEFPGWDQLRLNVEHMQKSRLSGLPEMYHPAVFELVLGRDEPSDYEAAVDWLLQQHQDTKDEYCFLLPAVDTESVTLLKTDHLPDLTAILLDASQQSDSAVAWFREITLGSSGIPIPVVLMYGAPSWQLHIKLDIKQEYTKDRVSMFGFTKGVLPPSFSELMSLLEPGVGQGVKKDVEEFFKVLKGLFGWEDTCKLTNSVEIQLLSIMAGSTQPASLASYNLTWLGTVLPKHWKSSTGDNQWWKSYLNLQVGLQCYMQCDIQQVAVMAWLMVVVWVQHLFPDFSLVVAATGHSMAEFLNFWNEKVVKDLLVATSENGRSVQLGEFRSREELIRNARFSEAQRFDILRLCPTWPALTGGLARYLDSAGAFLYANYSVLRRFNPDVFVPLSFARMRTLFLKEQPVVVPPAVRLEPVERLGLDVVPERKHPFFNLRPAEITRVQVTNAVRELGTTTRAMMADYFRLDPDRAECLLAYWEADDQRLLYQFCMAIGFRLVEDLRLFLMGIGKLGERPSGWVDPFNLTRFAEKRQRQVEHIELGQQHTAAKKARGEALLATAQKMIDEAAEKERRLVAAKEAAKGPVPLSLTETHPLMRGMEPSAERRPKCKPSQRKRRQLQARKLRETGVNSIPVEGMRMEVSNTTSSEATGELNTAVSSEAEMEVGAMPIVEVEMERRPQSSQDSGSETRTVRILSTGGDDDEYWSDAGLYSPGTPEPAHDEEEDVLFLDVRSEDRRTFK